MTDEHGTFAISGAAYYAACDPHASSVPTEEGWPVPIRRRAGRGSRYLYPTEYLDRVVSHMQEVASGFLSGKTDPETRAEGRALMCDVQRLRTIQKEMANR